MDESKRIHQPERPIARGERSGGRRRQTRRRGRPPEVPPSMKFPGGGMSEYGSPAKYESKVTRTLIRSQPGTTGSGASRTPLESLDGHDHAQRAPTRAAPRRRAGHRPGQASATHPRPGEASADLHRGRAPALSDDLPNPLPRVLRQQPGALPADPPNLPPETHGLVSCSEWTGVPLRRTVEEAGSTRARSGSSPRARTPPP